MLTTSSSRVFQWFLLTIMLSLSPGFISGQVNVASTDTIPSPIILAPWSSIDLTTVEMKPFYNPVAVPGRFPFIPVIGSVLGAGALVYVLANNHSNEEDCSFSASATASPSTCGQDNGSISITVNVDAIYQWSNGATTKDLHGVAAGDYTVTITRPGTSCTQVRHVTVTNIDTDITTTFTTTDSDCGSQNGIATPTVNPPGAYTYQWSNGSKEQVLNQLAPGTYTLTVTAIGSCQDIASVTIHELPPNFDVSFTTTSATCGMNDGSVFSNVTPPGEYMYAWSNGTTEDNLVGLASGSYDVTISKAGTTCQIIRNVTVTELPPAFTITISTIPANCGMQDGSAQAVVDQPGEYTYQWSDGQTTSQLINVNAGQYDVTVTLTGTKCSISASAVINELPPSFTMTTTTTPSTCGMTDGTATVIVDPPGLYEYHWSNGQTTNQATGLATGNYFITVTIQGSSCSLSSEVMIDQLPPSFSPSANTTPATCGLSDGSASITVDPVGEYTFLWSNGETTPQIMNVSAGQYSVTVTIPGTTCSQILQIQIDELPASFTVNINTTPTGCGQGTGTATAIVDPAGEYIYQWSNGQMTSIATGLAQGDYIVSISIQGSTCVVTDTAHIEQIMANFTGTITTNPADCGLANGSAMIVINPPGNYTYQWSNQQAGTEIQNISAGIYSITVTDENLCTASFSGEVAEKAVAYINITNTIPGNCTGGGEITFTLSTNGTGPLQVDITGPINTTMTLSPGTYNLSTFIEVVPGTYTLQVFDQSIGQACLENESGTVVDDTPALIVTDDFYITAGQAPVDGNMLSNDSGLGLSVISVSGPTNGSLVFDSNGQFTYIADAGFNGEDSFTYTVTDACGNSSTAIVNITVEMVVCDFSISTFITPAHCGLEDGFVNVEVNEPGTYTYFWDNGQTGPELIDVAANQYLVTIEDVNLGCSLEFEIEVTEFPAEYIEDVEITQPTCSDPGDIMFLVNAPLPQDELTMRVTLPDGTTHEFTIDPGTVNLRDYVPLIPGEYTIEIYIGNVGSNCIDILVVALNNPPMIEIEAISVTPPSSPSAMDGTATVTASMPGALPYIIFLDGIPVGTANNQTFIVGGMGVGQHTINVQDANGCVSNIIIVDIPFPDIIFSFSTSFLISDLTASYPEQATVHPEGILLSGMVIRLQPRSVLQSQNIWIWVGKSLENSSRRETSWMQLEYRKQIMVFPLKSFIVYPEGGIGWITPLNNPHVQNHLFLSLSATTELTICKQIQLQASLGIRGWRKLEKPVCSVSASVPFSDWRP